MIFEAAIAALLVGLLLGGSLKGLLELRLRLPALLLLPVLANLLPQIPGFYTLFAGRGEAAAILLAVLRYGFLTVFAAVNIRLAPVDLIGLGGLCNCLVTLFNGGRMPVSPAALSIISSDQRLKLLGEGRVLNYAVANSQTRLGFLGDIIYFRCYSYYFLSIGDVLIACGIFGLILCLMKPRFLLRARERLIHKV